MLRSIDSSIEDAARDLGSSKWRTFSTITVPLVRPGIANAFLLVFIKSVADFANPMAIGGNFSTLATQVYLQAIGSYDVQGGAAVAVVLLDIAMILFILSKYWVEKKTYVTVLGKASRERAMIKDPAVVIPVAGFCFLVTAVVLAIYVLIPIASLIKCGASIIHLLLPITSTLLKWDGMRSGILRFWLLFPRRLPASSA